MGVIGLFLFICFCIGLCNVFFTILFGIGQLVIENPLAFIGLVLLFTGIIYIIK